MFHGLVLWPLFFWSPFHGLFSLLIFILVISLIFRRRYYYYGHPWGWHPSPTNSRSEALAILEGRYARGEIQREEYLQKKQDLGGGA
jgi:putative membrane protein